MQSSYIKDFKAGTFEKVIDTYIFLVFVISPTPLLPTSCSQSPASQYEYLCSRYKTSINNSRWVKSHHPGVDSFLLTSPYFNITLLFYSLCIVQSFMRHWKVMHPFNTLLFLFFCVKPCILYHSQTN